jgi:hypothetical protein
LFLLDKFARWKRGLLTAWSPVEGWFAVADDFWKMGIQRQIQMIQRKAADRTLSRKNIVIARYVTASVARQSMNSGGMDCFTAFAMTYFFRNHMFRSYLRGLAQGFNQKLM